MVQELPDVARKRIGRRHEKYLNRLIALGASRRSQAATDRIGTDRRRAGLPHLNEKTDRS
jgi:hypothetical protein